MIDRIEPSRRPPGPNAGSQRWRSLAFLHWPVDQATLRGIVPPSLELDTFGGEAFVGVVAFSITSLRPSYLPAFAALRFLETNVRTYVVGGGRPGVYFFSLDAASRLAVRAARLTFGLPYHHADMSLSREGDVLAYSSARRQLSAAALMLRIRPGPPLGPLREGTIDHFLLERYLLFVSRRGRIQSTQVHHVPYPAHGARVLDVEDGLVAAAGLPPVAGPPRHAHFSPGVDVEIFALRDV